MRDRERAEATAAKLAEKDHAGVETQENTIVSVVLTEVKETAAADTPTSESTEQAKGQPKTKKDSKPRVDKKAQRVYKVKVKEEETGPADNTAKQAEEAKVAHEVEVVKVATEVKPSVVEHATKAAHVEKPVEPIQAEVTDHHKKEHKQKAHAKKEEPVQTAPVVTPSQPQFV